MHSYSVFCFFAVLPSVFALQVSVRRYIPSPRSQQGSSDPYNFSLINEAGDGRIRYAATLNIDSRPFTVVLDSGSSDLWVNSGTIDPSFTVVDTNVTGAVPYMDGTAAAGKILLSSVKFGDYIVDQQAFISAPASNASSGGIDGLLGVGPPPISQVKLALQNITFNGSPFLERLFSQSPVTPGFMTFQLNRSGPGLSDGGIFTIGEVANSLASIEDTPKLDVVTEHKSWSVLMDAITVNGHPYQGHSFSEVPPYAPAKYPGKFIATMDTGSPLAAAPKEFVDMLYGNIPGAQPLSIAPGFWSFPCGTRLNVSLVFNGTPYFVHPIDLTRVAPINNTLTCVNAIVPLPSNDHQVEDFVLGASFLRNVYILYSFGNYTAGRTGSPYIQLLSTTNMSQANADFESLNTARLQQWQAVLGGSLATPTPTAPMVAKSTLALVRGAIAGSSSGSDSGLDAILRNSYIAIGLVGGVMALLCALVAMMISSRRRDFRYSALRE